jgi:DNA-binding winged helix-turn-helix (wHTH) protein
MNATDVFAFGALATRGVDGLKTETSMTTRVTSSVKRCLRLRFDRFELDESDARLTRDGNPVPLTPRVFAVLCELARTPQSLVTKNALLDAVWGHRFVSDSALKSAISTLRTALADDAKHPRYIETVSRRGYRFVGAVSTPSALPPTPARAIGPLSAEENAPSLIGRTSELERLRNAWRRAAAGERQIVLIAGEAGVGKTKLIERFVSEVGELHCAHGQCVEQHGAGEPYLAVLEALAALCRRDASLADLIRTVAPTWLHQLPWLSSAAERQALQREFSGEVQAPMLREAGELLDRYTESRPLLLVTEDLHWSDRATVQLINYIARRRTGTRLLWLASFRPVELIAADHPLQAVRRELRFPGLLEEIFLDSFSEQEVSEYLAQRSLTLGADETFVRALHDRTGGLPLFVADFANDLVAHANSATAEASSACLRLASMPIPETWSAIVERHIDRLEPAQRAVLEAASVCGLEFRISAVAAALDVAVTAVAELCAQLAHSGRWLREGSLELPPATTDAVFLFRHALYREVLYKRIAPLVRMRLHRRVETSLEGGFQANSRTQRGLALLPTIADADTRADREKALPASVPAHKRQRQLRVA